jgi:hypothetical protein
MHALTEFVLRTTVLIGVCYENQNVMEYSKCESKIEYTGLKINSLKLNKLP